MDIGFLEECPCVACCEQDASKTHQNADSEKRRVEERQSREEAALPKSLATEQFNLKWQEWLAYRKEKRKPVSKRAAEKQLATLESHGEAVAIAAIDQAIASDWQGLFPEKLRRRTGSSVDHSYEDELESNYGWGRK
jgi:hypothetical protein